MDSLPSSDITGNHNAGQTHLPIPFSNLLGGIVGGVSFLHVLLPGTVDDVFSLVRGPEDVHFCGAMCGNAGGV